MRSIIKSIIRIIIIFLFINSLISFITNATSLWRYRYSYTMQNDVWNGLGILFGAFLVAVLILWILWWKAGFLTRVLAGNINDNKLEINTSNVDLFKMALIFLGVYLLATSIPDIVGLIGYHIRITALDESIALTPQDQAGELRLWIGPIVTVLIGFGLVIGIKNRWWLKSGSIRNENKNMIPPSRPFNITKIDMDGFDPEKVYPVFAINMEQYSEKDSEYKDTESPASQNIAFFLTGDDNGDFAWIAEDECKLAPSKE